MDNWQCCRTCLCIQNLNQIFPMPDHSQKYSDVIFATTGVKVEINDTLPQQMCSQCINFVNESYKFRKKCEESQKSLLERLKQKPLFEIKIELSVLKSEVDTTVDISEFVEDNEFRDYDDNITLSQYNVEAEKCSNKLELANPAEKFDTDTCKDEKKITKDQKSVKKRGRTKKENQEQKRCRNRQKVKEEIECELCHKVLTSKLSLRNHYKIHTGFDVVCEHCEKKFITRRLLLMHCKAKHGYEKTDKFCLFQHCGKKFITRRLLLMHCKAKHGYEKTDKCSFCDYRASNAEQVKIHERLHTGERPYVCETCGSGFHRKSSYLQHVAIHLPEKTVQCDQCPARFKSVTLMRIHRNRHRPTQYTYKCRVCDNNFARRRNVVRHLLRIHSLNAESVHIDRTKCV